MPDELYNEVIRSKKYSALHEPLVRRICDEEGQKHKGPERTKAVKTRLHLIYGAYLKNDMHKKAEQLLDKFDLEGILRLHASSAERTQIMPELYRFIFDHAPCARILDIGCGLNPFSLPYMPEKPSVYHAVDIDARTVLLINRYFVKTGLPPLCECIDVIAKTPRQCADTAFLFKLMPVIENQKPGRGFELLNELKTKYAVVTYPLKSLGGREKGMGRQYASVFEGLAGERHKIIGKASFKNELVYILALKNND